MQEALAGKLAPVKRTKIPEGFAVTTPPAQVVVAEGVGAITKPAGKLSCNTICVSARALGLVSRSANGAASPG